MKFHEVKKRTAEPQNIEYRMSKGGFAPLSHFFYKIDRIHSFDIHYSIFDIRFFKVSFLDQTGLFTASGWADT
jgi:hypothetical protein